PAGGGVRRRRAARGPTAGGPARWGRGEPGATAEEGAAAPPKLREQDEEYVDWVAGLSTDPDRRPGSD
ncbi:MAG TPA: hypothetical protein VES42_11740, partial [Pilimelia sp.]|nr:hypothetical protein [Pilimelia sp.]